MELVTAISLFSKVVQSIHANEICMKLYCYIHINLYDTTSQYLSALLWKRRITDLLTYLITYLLIYLLPYLLTPWSRVHLEKLTVCQLVKKFPAFYGNRKLITAFTSARPLSLSWAKTQNIYLIHFFLSKETVGSSAEWLWIVGWIVMKENKIMWKECCGLVGGTIPALLSRDWGKPRSKRPVFGMCFNLKLTTRRKCHRVNHDLYSRTCVCSWSKIFN